MLDEVEARAAHAAIVQRLVFGISKRVVDNADAPDVRRIVGDGVEHGAVVAAVAARLHDDRAIDAEMAMQCRQHLLGRVLWGVTPVRRIGEFGGRPEHVAVGVGRPRRQLEFGLAAIAQEVGPNVHEN